MKRSELELFKDELKNHIADTIKVTVNGKIDRMDEKLNKYIAEDTAWKAQMEPVRTTFENSRWTIKLFVGLLKILALLAPAGAGFLWVKKLLND